MRLIAWAWACGVSTPNSSACRPLGFDLSDKHVKRAGLDYWPRVDVSVHDSWEAFEGNVLTTADKVVMYSKQGKNGTSSALDAGLTCVLGWDVEPRLASRQLTLCEWLRRRGEHVCLVFGSEDKGFGHLPDSAFDASGPHQQRSCVFVPMRADTVRSLNLSNVVAMACFDALKQNPGFAAAGDWV